MYLCPPLRLLIFIATESFILFLITLIGIEIKINFINIIFQILDLEMKATL
jgi:hypothetical protein